MVAHVVTLHTLLVQWSHQLYPVHVYVCVCVCFVFGCGEGGGEEVVAGYLSILLMSQIETIPKLVTSRITHMIHINS